MVRNWSKTDTFSEQTPNFAMDTTDVDSSADRAQERFTSHLFAPELKELLPALSGSAIRVSSDTSIWPPTMLFDAVYAGVVMRHFGLKDSDSGFLKKYGDIFYPGGPTKAAHADDKHRRDQDDAAKENIRQSNARRDKRQEARDPKNRGTNNAVDPLDVAMMYRFKAVDPEKVKAYLKECEAVTAERERKGLEEKVNSWRESLAPLN